MPIDNRVTHVLVSLMDIPLQGTSNVLVRMQAHDRDLITKAARVVDISQQQFMRAILVSAARKVLSEAGVK